MHAEDHYAQVLRGHLEGPGGGAEVSEDYEAVSEEYEAVGLEEAAAAGAGVAAPAQDCEEGASNPLPFGWTALVDPTSGWTYYVGPNEETTWVRPVVEAAPLSFDI